MKHKKLIGIIALLLMCSPIMSQVLTPVKWTFRVAEVKGNEATLKFKATMDGSWHIYSQEMGSGGPIPTSFSFQPGENYELIGEVVEQSEVIEKYDNNFMMSVLWFDDSAVFTQKVKILSTAVTIEGTVEYMACNNQMCLPPDEVAFSLAVQRSKSPEKSSPDSPSSDNRRSEREGLSQKPDQKEPGSKVKSVGSVKLDTQSTDYEQGGTPPPASLLTSSDIDRVVQNPDSLKQQSKQILYSGDKSFSDTGGSKNQEPKTNSLFAFMLLAFVSGIAALLTPCVFPMIPLTVSFFSKSSAEEVSLPGRGVAEGQGTGRTRSISRAVLFGLSIILIYVLAGSIVARLNGPEFANWLSTHWLPNIFFFLIFLVFAASFLGMFDIVLPSSWVNAADRQADKRSGLIGVFFMAFTLVLVSFSCTAPIVGNVLVLSAGGEIIKPIAGMFAFSFALALPFSLFAAFPGWLQQLPRSGGWLNSVKVVLGFLELALGLKFLSVADQVYHWGLLDREVYLAFWIVIFTLLGFYLLGKIRLPNDSQKEKTSVPGLLLSIIVFSFVIYLIPGMFGAPLKPLAGYLPPLTTQDFNLHSAAGSLPLQGGPTFREWPQAGGGLGDVQKSRDRGTFDCPTPKYSEFLHLPHGLFGYFDLDQALACARAQNKPIFIDFTGHGCVNCREMEARVWSDPEVLRRLRNDYVVVALYVDEKTDLPEEEWYQSSFNGKLVKTVGRKNADFQITRFANNAQPFYVLIDHNKKLLAQPRAYDLNIQNFISFLDEGLAEFKKQ